eukprot:Gb_27516 [translate_table: standard]
MHRAAKWKAEKSKVKVVFRLQFHATQVPQPGWDKLFVSFIPAETGKVIAKTTKVSVRNGSCKWSDPIYETTRLLQDAKTKKYDEKQYKLVVSTGSSRFGFLGEASINLADYAEAVKPSSVSLALQSCSFGTILHVTVQPLTAKTGFREFEQQREHAERGFPTIATEENADDEPDGSTLNSKDIINGHGVKDNSQDTSKLRISSDYLEVSSMQQSSEANGNHRGQATDSAISPSNPESNCTAKQEGFDIHEIGSMKNGIRQDAESFLSSLGQVSRPPKSGSNISQALAYPRQMERSSSEWTHGWSSDHSTENDASNIYDENERLRVNLQTAESSIIELMEEVAALERQAKGQAAEMETLMQQLAAEIEQGQGFAREISALKSECDGIKSDFEQVKVLEQGDEKHRDAGSGLFDPDDTRCILEDLKQELDAVKQENINLTLQLKKTEKSYSELLLCVQEASPQKKNNDVQQISSNSRLDRSMHEEMDQTRSFQDIELEWLQKVSCPEEKIREIKHKIVIKDNGSILDFLKDDLENLERVFREVRQENLIMVGKLNSEIITRNKKIADLEYGRLTSPMKFSPSGSIVNNLEVNAGAKKLQFCLDEDETPSKQNLLHDLPLLQDTLLQLDSVQLKLKSKDQNFEKAGEIYGLDIAEMESQLLVSEQEVWKLSALNHQLEMKVGNLELENLELQNCLNVGHKHGILASEQIRELTEEVSSLTGKAESERGLRINTDRQKSELGNDRDDIEKKLLYLQEQNFQLLKRIAELEAQLKHEIESNEVHLSAEKASEDFRKIESALNSTHELEEKIHALSIEAEDYKSARDSLLKEAEQMEYEYEALVQELEERALYLGRSEKMLQEQLQNLRDEYESEVEKLQQELDKQAQSFAAERDDMALYKTKLEQRANRAEAALKKIRWNNASTVEQLQKELERLSIQISSTFGANEKLATEAFAEASQLRAEKNNLQEKIFLMQESLQNANIEIAFIREQCEANVQEVMAQLDLSRKREEELLSKLQNTSSELANRVKCETNDTTRNEELSVKILMLEREVQAVLNEKNNLLRKVEECKGVKAELESSKISLDSCKTEREGLEASLQRINQENIKLEMEISSLKETLRHSDAELEELKCCRHELKMKVAFLQSTLEEQHAQISLHNEQTNELMHLHRENSELKHRLSEQELKTEDLKDLFRLQKELQQKADAEAYQLHAEKNILEENSKFLQESLEKVNAEIVFIREQCDAKVQEFMTQLDLSNKHGEELSSKLQTALGELENQMISETSYIKRFEEMSRKLSMLETEVQVGVTEKNELVQKVKECEGVKAELEINKINLDRCKAEKAELEVSLRRLNQLKSNLDNEINSLKETLDGSSAELDALKSHRDELEITVAFLKTKLDDQHAQISFHNEQKNEFMRLRRQYSELKHRLSEQESEMEDLREDLFLSKDLQQKTDAEASQLRVEKNDLKKHSTSLQESVRSADAEIALMKEQYEAKVQELMIQLDLSTKHSEELLSKLQSALSELENRTKREANCIQKNEELSARVSMLETEVQTILHEKRDLIHEVESYKGLKAELESARISLDSCNADRAEITVSLQRSNQEKDKLDEDIGSLREMLRNTDSELNELKRHRDELELTVAFLQSNLDDQHAQISFHNEQKNELMQLRSQHSELKHKLSEQELKTEDLRRHSIHLKELQEKADAELSQLHAQKKDLEENSTIMQDSLRIAFIKEQCEAKEQELLTQLVLSKKHGEELFLNLQEAWRELEVRNEREMQYTRRNEELSIKLLTLETEIQSVLNEKSDLVQKVNKYKAVNAELESNRICLDSCKAEKAELEFILQKANLEREQLDNELSSLKEMLRYTDVELDEMKHCRDELEIIVASLQSKLDGQHAQISPDNEQNNELVQLRQEYNELKQRLLEQELKAEELMNNKLHLQKELQQKTDMLFIDERKLKENDANSKVSGDGSPLNTDSKNNSRAGSSLTISSSYNEKELADLQEKVKLLESEVRSKSIALEASWQEFSAKEKKLQNNIEEVEMIKENLKEESLNSSMDRLHKELEKMKNDNLAPFQQEHELLYELSPEDPLQKEVQQLQLVNKQLESMFPSFKESAKGGNAIDRVLALETELAETLKANGTHKRQFQSSFVKQQTDHAAVLQSFRDINELINDMLELKRKNSMLEDELKELQHRYSQVSLQFAEVEGERQQLVMTLKNLRIGKKS